ncbi:aspartyl protease family protein [Terrimonas rubra]|uniref:Aspartyl protease family protein n=1 Tax=Terrimonas rubra TaxID=1035890 RepID=A0ABW6A4V4_9BACT
MPLACCLHGERKFVPAILLLFTLWQAKPAHAQEEYIEPPSKFITRLPITLFTGGVIVLRARLDDHPDTLNFILDTGSSGISLDSTTTDYLKLKPTEPQKTIRGIAGLKRVGMLNDRTLYFPGLAVDSLDFHVNDYQTLTSVYGEKIDGIIGYSFLSRYILKINYDSAYIDVCSRGSIKYPKGGYLFRPFINTLPVQAAAVKDNRTVQSRFLYDIGAGLCVLFSKDFIEDSAFLKKKRKVYAKQAEGLGGKIDMHITILKEFRLGPYKFKKIPVNIFDDEFNVTSYPSMGGIIGNDLLRRFNCILNYSKREFHLKPNTHYNESFDYAYSGLEMYMIDGDIQIAEVAKNSPAEKAGLKMGDVVIGVNNDFTQNLNRYKVAMQAPKQKVKMVIRRDGKLQEVTVSIKSIL